MAQSKSRCSIAVKLGFVGSKDLSVLWHHAARAQNRIWRPCVADRLKCFEEVSFSFQLQCTYRSPFFNERQSRKVGDLGYLWRILPGSTHGKCPSKNGRTHHVSPLIRNVYAPMILAFAMIAVSRSAIRHRAEELTNRHNGIGQKAIPALLHEVWGIHRSLSACSHQVAAES